MLYILLALLFTKYVFFTTSSMLIIFNTLSQELMGRESVSVKSGREGNWKNHIIKMHSYGYRANALLTFAITILAVICAMASLSDNLNSPSPSAQVQVFNINWFQKQPNGNDEVSMTMNISADLQSLFTWNTKQVFVFLAAEYETSKNSLNQISLWDGIIPSKDHARFWIHTSNKYRFIDQGSNLLGKKFNLTMHWHVMPKTGKMFADKIVMPGYRLPEEYR
ncbi:hypothetical protein VNO77_13588 [Canavalia gladiata]|uniref:Signal peptidase complex subunit 3 n=1 Tax=Canavalia gladiata TaxID=3824 RepID=A0AAN9QQC8_CANGL